MATLTYAGKLTVVTCWCGLHHAVPDSLYAEAQRTGMILYCPLGHSYGWSSENTRLRKRVADLEARLTWARDDAAYQRKVAMAAQRRAAARKGQLTKAFNRLRAGVCPLCRRNFEALGRHMRDQHPTAMADVEREPEPE